MMKANSANTKLQYLRADMSEDMRESLNMPAHTGLYIMGSGDIDASGFSDSTDARLALQGEVKLIHFTEQQAAAADVNEDNELDSTDARLILQYEVGLIKGF